MKNSDLIEYKWKNLTAKLKIVPVLNLWLMTKMDDRVPSHGSDSTESTKQFFLTMNIYI